MKTLLALFCSAILVGVAFADTTIDISTYAPPVSEGESFTISKSHTYNSASSVWIAYLTVTIQNVTASSFEMQCKVQAAQDYTSSFTILALIGGHEGARNCPSFGTVSAKNKETNSNKLRIIGLMPNTTYWILYQFAGDRYSTCIRTSPANIKLGSVATSPGFDNCEFSVPIAEIGTFNGEHAD